MLRGLLSGALLTLLLGCEDVGQSFELSPGGDKVVIAELEETQREGMRRQVVESLEYGRSLQKLRVGDVMEVLFQARRTPSAEPYAVAPGDLLTIDFADTPGAAVTQRVAPDGWISLPETGVVRAAGLTVPELNALVNQRYSRVFRNPQVDVRLEEGTSAEQQFLADIESVGNGRSRNVPVTRDGRVTLPFLRPIEAVGLSLPEITQRVNGAYAQIGLDLEVSVLFSQSAGDRVYVLGEVTNPGLYVNERPQTVLMTVAQAGGVEITGSLGDVRVFYMSADGTPRLRRVNLLNVLTKLSLEEDMTLPDNSVIYVPETGIAKTGRVLDQVLRQILFFQGTSVGFSYDLNPTTQ
ncbi:MAG: polysaccharide biosynthesis/export family protein [Rhodospirillaceae bacterium]